MWPFKRKSKSTPNTPVCPGCGSRNTRVAAYSDAGDPDPIRAWRGERYVGCRCADCGHEFLIPEPKGGLPNEFFADERIVEDEEALRVAEEELKRQTDEGGDRRHR